MTRSDANPGIAQIKAGESALAKIAWSPSTDDRIVYTQDFTIEWSAEFNGGGQGDIADNTVTSTSEDKA